MRSLVVVCLALAACARTADAPGPSAVAEGTERGACYGNHTCNAGLTCLSDLCVKPPGADCDKVAEKLSQLMLGNYAEQGTRAAYLATTRDECVAANLGVEDGACILNAPHRNALSTCERLVGVGDCTKILAHLKDLPGTDPYQVTSADHVIGRCKNEIPSKAFETCALAAMKVSELDACSW